MLILHGIFLHVIKMQEEIVQENRRDFLKKALGTTAVVATAGSSGVLASAKSDAKGSNGVVYGKSPKKEILYAKTANWDAYYRAAV